MRAYVIVSLLTGARTEELRALTWSHVDLDGDPPTVSLGDRSAPVGIPRRRSLGALFELPGRCVDVLRVHRKAQLQSRVAAGERWATLDLVFATSLGSPLDAANVRRAFRRVAATAGLDCSGVDPARAAAQLCVAAVEHWPIDRRHLAFGRPREHPRHRECLPQGTAARPKPWRRGYGRAVSRFSGQALVSKLVSMAWRQDVTVESHGCNASD